VMMVFILVPALAPALGQLILAFAPWQAIFILYMGLTLVILVWFGLRQPETLVMELRIPYSASNVLKQVIQIMKLKESMGPTLALGIVFGAFLGYLSSSQQIFQGLYDKGNQFALYFGLLALAFGGASLLNARLVRVYGMGRLSHWALYCLTCASGVYFLFTLSFAGVPPFWSFILFLAISFFCIAVLFGNLNAMAMEPLGQMAGIGASVVGATSTLISAGLGLYIGQLYDETLSSLVASYAILGVLSILTLVWAGRPPHKT